MTLSPLIRSLSIAVVAAIMTTLGSASLAADQVKIVGAGASFPAPIYLRWVRDYYLAHPDVRIDYQAIGSGGGIANLINGMLDFAGSDVPMKPEDAAKVPGGVVQLPMTAGAVVIAYNLPGIDDLRLSREAVSGIFMGRIAQWSDPLIAAANPGVELPDQPIVVVARGDASGTSFVTTRQLGAMSHDFAENVGVGMNPDWPKALKERGALVRGLGNGGVAAYIRAIPGSIGYLQYAYAHLGRMQMAQLQDRAGELVPPRGESFRADLDLSAVSAPKGDGSYPFLSLSWMILRKDYPDEKAAVIKDFLRYALTDGQRVAEPLGYIPLPDSAVKAILEKTQQIH